VLGSRRFYEVRPHAIENPGFRRLNA